MANTLQELLQGNAQWAEKIKSDNPEFFETLSKGQSPAFLWIGCSDSRVPETTVTGEMPGSLFVQRNIANQVLPTDTSLESVVFYAVHHLKVKHIIICGHYGCGGVQAAMSDKSFGVLDKWLVNIKDVFAKHEEELNAISSEQEKFDRLVELNVIEQVKNMAKTPFIQNMWKIGEVPYIHGLVYSLKDGTLKDLNASQSSTDKLEKVYKVEA